MVDAVEALSQEQPQVSAHVRHEAVEVVDQVLLHLLMAPLGRHGEGHILALGRDSTDTYLEFWVHSCDKFWDNFSTRALEFRHVSNFLT